MPTYEIQRVRTFRMNEILTIKAEDTESAVMAARVRMTPPDVRRLFEDKNSMYLIRVIKLDDL